MNFVNIHGQPVNTDALPTARKAPKSFGRGEFHDGFVVEGYAPGRIAEAEAEHNASRRRAAKEGEALPPEWSESAWLRKHKPTRVRSKPYEVLSAAETCADLARKAGWQFVGVRALKSDAAIALADGSAQ